MWPKETRSTGNKNDCCFSLLRRLYLVAREHAIFPCSSFSFLSTCDFWCISLSRWNTRQKNALKVPEHSLILFSAPDMFYFQWRFKKLTKTVRQACLCVSVFRVQQVHNPMRAALRMCGGTLLCPTGEKLMPLLQTTQPNPLISTNPNPKANRTKPW